ncbi:MAG: Gx transporter family protein [Clostridiaceae bacterium]|nr:Gx transporter family protein [Clostridiaceae bacterium]
MEKAKKLVFMSLLIAQAIILYIVEGMLPVPFITPGAKLGLANIITVVSMYIFSFRETLLIVIIRILLATFFGGNVSSFLFSVTGGVLSLVAMYITKQLGKENVSIWGISITGSIFHSIGQILVAAFLIQNMNIAVYLPILLVAGVGTGFFIGLASKHMLVHLNKLTYIEKLRSSKGGKYGQFLE